MNTIPNSIQILYKLLKVLTEMKYYKLLPRTCTDLTNVSKYLTKMREDDYISTCH